MIDPSSPSASVASERPFAGAIARALRAGVVALVVYFALFRLPFLFPPRQRLMSPSYTYGFNNSVAIVATAVLLGAVALWYLLRRRRAVELPVTFAREGDTAGARTLRTAFAVACACYAVVTFGMYLYDVNLFPWLMWEARHLLHRTWIMDLYGLRPYTELSAEYGPILTYAPSAMFWLLRPLGGSHEQAYFLAHLLLNLAGLWCLWYVLSRAVMPSRERLIAFVLLAIAGFGPSMGVNGVLVRYLFPFASLLLGHRALSMMLSGRPRPMWWGGAFISVLSLVLGNILLSPEIGLAFVLAWLGYAVLTSRRDARVLVVSVLVLLAAAVLCRLFLPAAYYGTLLRFSEGANNFPLVPALHLLLYIPTLFLIVPQLVAASLRETRSGDASIGGVLGMLCVVMAPGALGRCDPPHVLFYGMGACMLLMIRLANISWRRFLAYAVAYGTVFILFMTAVNVKVFYGVGPNALFTPRGLKKLVHGFRAGSGTSHLDAATMSALDRYPRLGLPLATFGDPAVERYVITTGKLVPEYYVAIVGVYNEAALERKLREVAGMEYLLVPEYLATRGTGNPCGGYLEIMQHWFFYPVNLPCRGDPVDPTMAVRAFIADNYTSVEKIGPWVVLRRVGDASAIPPVSRYLSSR